MRRGNFYLLCAFPALNQFGSPPPIGKQELLALVTESDGPADIVQALLLSEDLLQREAVLAGDIEPDQADTAVLSLAQAQDMQPLPDFLMPDSDDAPEDPKTPLTVDTLWQRFFRYTEKLARDARSPFLAAWIEFEVGLRNAMVIARAEALELDPKPYMVAPELADPDISFDAIITEWSAASNPLEALEALDRARWRRLTEHERWYSFSDDEVAAYTAKLLLLHRWHRIFHSDRQSAENRVRP
jgi:hypothetical protein